MNIEIKIPLSDIARMTPAEMADRLIESGLDIDKDIHFYDLAGMFRVFEGTALPAPHSGYMKTCVGMVPIRKPWLEAVA